MRVKTVVFVLALALVVGAGLRWFQSNVLIPFRLPSAHTTPLTLLLIRLKSFSFIYLYSLKGPVGAAFAAKLVCSNVFLAGRSPDEVIEDDLRGMCVPPSEVFMSYEL